MKRIVIIGALFCTWAGTAFGQAMPGRQFQEGVHFFRIEQAPVQRESVTVMEVFSYLCNHCNTFEPYMQNWKARKPENVAFRRIPVSFGRREWELYARAYVAASLMGIEEESHVPMMDKLWKERAIMRSMDELAGFYTQFGVDRDAFLATARSFAADAQMRREQRQVATFGITGTPSMVVNGLSGDYRVASNREVSNFETMLQVVDFVVARELAAQVADVEAPADMVADAESAAN